MREHEWGAAGVLLTDAKYLPRMQRLVLKVLYEAYDPDQGFCYLAFMTIATRGNITRQQAKRAVRQIAKLGYAECRHGLWHDDGSPAGSGYGLTTSGVILAKIIFGDLDDACRSDSNSTV